MRSSSVGICSACGGELICARSEAVGREEYAGCYTHSCSACGYNEYQSEWIRDGVVDCCVDPRLCPECERIRRLKEQ